ncbi:hypothetical protein KO561_06440 [Radiobacillus kanasensis]|uniref:hypothetical protein n=1 Tax=Radiobacillus kanasensis TaxID=2844358 RepID=UPI001E57B8C9|nr:hypothetical protein [Radiobacillus kanasensis]UFU00575.1 hypothetical protein KO561_06440 [Radiobacillus kanasensis]
MLQIQQQRINPKQWLNSIQNFRRKGPPRHTSESEKQWRQWLYQHHHHPTLLPSICFIPVPSQFRMRCPIWMWQSILFFHLFNIGDQTFQLNDCHHLLASYLVPSSATPLVKVSSNPIQEYVDQLLQIGILMERDSGYTYNPILSLPNTLEKAKNQDYHMMQKLMRV